MLIIRSVMAAGLGSLASMRRPDIPAAASSQEFTRREAEVVMRRLLSSYRAA